MKRLLVITFLFFQFGFTQEIKHQVFFDTDVYAISNKEQQKLLRFIADLDIQKVYSIDIYGFCDDRASFEYNIVLSNNRANSVRNMLVNQNVPQQKLITILGKGEVPLSTNIEAEIPKVRQSNRKVEIIVNGIGEQSSQVLNSIESSYEEDVTDEFIKPIVNIDSENNPVGLLKDDDVVIFFNFRTDRGRQLTDALSQNDFHEYGMHKLKLHYVTMTNYDENFSLCIPYS